MMEAFFNSAAGDVTVVVLVFAAILVWARLVDPHREFLEAAKADEARDDHDEWEADMFGPDGRTS